MQRDKSHIIEDADITVGVESAVDMPTIEFSRESVEDVLKRRFFFTPSFGIYGGVAGLYDYGPPGCALKANMINFWREHFVLNESMLELDGTCLTPEQVLITSGHVAKFQDYMVKDLVTGNCSRADHLLKDVIDKTISESKDQKQIESLKDLRARCEEYDAEQLHASLTELKALSPENNPISKPYPFNLMFEAQIGPSGKNKGFLRPETAQNIFVNFKRLLEVNGGKLPFAAAQVGLAFRNEIAPRQGLLRVREFQMAEIEHFVREDDKDHPSFKDVQTLKMNLYPQGQQLGSKKLIIMSLGEAVGRGIIGNQTLGYFMARTFLFLLGCGVRREGIRFRQHLKREMAHYASDCWDAEILCSYGWIECVGHADRSCFDLTAHSAAGSEQLTAYVRHPQPITVSVVEAVLNKGEVGRAFKADAKKIETYLKSASRQQLLEFKTKLESGSNISFSVDDSKVFELTPKMVKVEQKDVKESGKNITPHVIEPSFGIGRILYTLLEHAHYIREGNTDKKEEGADKIARNVLRLPARIAPTKVSILPLLSDDALEVLIPGLQKDLARSGVSSKSDVSGVAIGRRYARTDEIGVPFGITIDYDTLKDNTVTLRERDSMDQVRIPLSEIVGVVSDLCEGRVTWEQVLSKYPRQEAKEKEEEKK